MRKKIKWYEWIVLYPIAKMVLYECVKRERVKEKAEDGTLTIWDLI